MQLFFLLVLDEENTIEEQEVMEGEADHKAELVDLAKDGNYLLYFPCVCGKAGLRRRNWFITKPNLHDIISKLGFSCILFVHHLKFH